jgi:A/G-specific adenine glycosylase
MGIRSDVSAVLSIAFGHAHAVVDGNVKRVLARIFQIDSKADSKGLQGLKHEGH